MQEKPKVAVSKIPTSADNFFGVPNGTVVVGGERGPTGVSQDITDPQANYYQDANGLPVGVDSAEKTAFPEIKVIHTPEDELLQVLTPVYQKAEEQLLKLRGVPGSEDLYNRYKRVVDYSYTWKAYADQQRKTDEEQIKSQEMEAQRLILEAESILMSANIDTADVESLYDQVKVIVNRLGSKVSPALQSKLDEFKKFMELKSLNKETK